MELSNIQTNLSDPHKAENKPRLTSKVQTLCVRNGSVDCHNRDTEISVVSELEGSCKDGVFWKFSEFHRRSGKHGLEERFSLLSPTVIVSCSGQNADQDELDSDQDRSAKNDIPNGREDTEDKRCLRKRPPVEYFPKDGNRQAKPENLDDEDKEKILTVLNWYKTECRFKDKFRNATREPCDQTKSSHKTTKFVRTNGLHLWQTKTVLMSLPDDRENENNNPDRVLVTSYIKGDINKTESIMNHSSKATESEVNENINSTESCSSKDMTNAECYLVDALNCSFRSDIVKDFEIDGLLNELDIHPVGLPESDQELRCHENVAHINLGSEPAVPESVTATPSTALDTSKEYTAEPLLMENQVSSNQAQCIDYVKSHLEYEDNGTESMFSHDTNEDVEFDIIKKQVEHVRNGLASPFFDLQLGNPTKAQNNELPEDYMKNGRDNVHDVLDFEKTGYMHNADVSIPVKIDGPEKCGKNTEDAIHEVCKIGQVGIASSHAVESNLNDKDKPESSIENEIDKDREILGIGQVCQTDGADDFNLDEKDDLEGQHKHGAAKRKINGSRILDRLKMDISGNGQSFKEIGEAVTFQYLTDDRSQNYFQSIPEKVKFDQRRKRKGSDVEETATMVCYHTKHDRDRENSTLHFSEPSPNSNCTTFPMAIETEPLNLSMHLDCRSDMNIHSTPVKKKRLTIMNGAMQISSKNRQDGFQKSNTSRPKCVKMSMTSLPVFNSKENDQCNAQKQCEQSSMQPEPLDLSVHDLKSSTENHVSNHQEQCVTVNKRVLRTRASVEYFPEKKKKRNNKGLRQNNKQVENSLSRPFDQPSNMNVNGTDCDENNKDCRPYIYFDPMELSPEPLDLSVDNKDRNAMDLEIERQIDGLCHGLHKEVSFRDGISEILAAQNDPSGLTGIQNDSNENAVTNTDMNNNTIKDTDEIDGCKPDEQEKAVNVHAVLVGLYAATNSKEGPPKTFLSGSEKFINGTRAYGIDELRNDNREFDELRSDNREDGETVTSNKDKTEDQEFDLVRGIKEKNKNISKFGSSTPTDLSSEPVRSVVETTFEDLSAENMMETSTIENNEENDHDNSSTTEVLQSSNVNVNDNLATSILNAPEQVSVTSCSQSEGLIENNKPTAEVNSVASKTTNDKHNAPDMTREIDTLTELRSCRQFNTQNNKNREVDTDRILASGELAVEGPSNFTQVLYVLCFTNVKISGERLQDQWSSGLFCLSILRQTFSDNYLRTQGLPVGTVVWGKFSKARWWPGVVIDGRMLKRETRQGYQWIFWLSDNRVSQLKEHHIELFTSQYKTRTAGKLKESMRIGIIKALKICAERAGVDLESFQSVEEWGQADIGFIKFADDTVNRALFPQDEASPLPLYILDQLGIITRGLSKLVDRVTVLDDTEVTDLDDSGVADLETPDDSGCATVKDRKTPEKLSGIKSYRGRDVMDCLSCDLPLTEEYQRYNHLLFEGYMCGKCKEWMMSSFYATDDDECSLYCGICGEGGKQFVCEKQLCGRAFCHSCIERVSGKNLVKQIEQTDPWYCFMCTDYNVVTHGNLVPRKDWQLEVVQFFQPDNISLCNDLHYLTSEKKRKIRVLSLFDGIGTGKQVLNELGLDVEVYYASEVNEDAKLVATCHHAVTHVGDAWRLTRDRLKELCPIDLVLAGPPCNDLSIVNPLRKGFNGTGILVVKFISILKDLEKLCENNHVFWLLENTGAMVLEYKNIICSLLGMEPAVWDAIHFTGQRRARNFWGNIPGLYSTPEYCKQLQKDKTDLEAALHTNCNRTARIPHLRTVTTGKNSLTIKNGEEALPIMMDGKEDGIWVSELERLFGFPDHYTDVGHLTPSTRHRLLGKAWCVPVIKHILLPLRQYFAQKET